MAYKDPEVRRKFKRELSAKYKAILNQIRGSKPCTDCGLSYPYYVMEFDHVPERGEKSKNIGAFGSRNPLTSPAFIEEINKCDIVCGNCHNIRTHQRRCKDEQCSCRCSSMVER